MNKDITSREDIELLVNEFYRKVKPDAVIGFFFTEVVDLSWDKHMPVMYDFWESVLLGTQVFRGNPMMKHIELSKKAPIERKHLERWLELFTLTVDQNFEGPKAEEAKFRARSIGEMILFKSGGGGMPREAR